MKQQLKNIFSFFLLIVCFFIYNSCRNEVDKAREDETITINKYIQDLEIDSITDNGLYYIQEIAGKGDTVKNNDFISVNLCATTIENNFCESYTHTDFKFVVGSGQVLKGINEGVQLMAEGGKAKFIIPFMLAYYSPNSNFNNYNTYLINIQVNEIIDSVKEWEINQITQYINDHNYSAKPDTNGFCYIELLNGTGDSIKINQNITLDYKCKLLNNKILFSSENSIKTFTLSYNSTLFFNDTTLNRALFNGLIQMKEQGKSVIIIPSIMAYGEKYIGTEVPSYSSFVFEINTIKIIQ